MASEIGKAWGRATYLVPTLRAVKPGTSGAISLEGTAAGIAGAAMLGGLAAALGISPCRGAGPDRRRGRPRGRSSKACSERRSKGPGILNNDVLNFINTAVAAGAAIVLYRAVT